MARALIALVLLGLVVVALCPPSVAHAAFGPPQTIDRGDPDRPIVLAANDRGDRVLVYSVGEVRRMVFAAAGRRFGRSHDLPVAPDGDEFRVAVGPQGDALIVWTYYDNSIAPADIDIDDEGCCHGVKAVVVPAGRAPGPVKTLWPKGTEVAVGGMAIRDTRRFGVAANVSVLPEGGTGFARPVGV